MWFNFGLTLICACGLLGSQDGKSHKRLACLLGVAGLICIAVGVARLCVLHRRKESVENPFNPQTLSGAQIQSAPSIAGHSEAQKNQGLPANQIPQ